MPRRPPPPDKRIQPGTTRNPSGSSAKARARAALRRMTADDLADMTSLLFTSDRTKINDIANDPASSFMQILTAKLLVDCYKKGDIGIYRALVEQTIGRPRQQTSVTLTGADGGPVRTSEMSTEDMLAEVKRLQRQREELGDT